MYAGRLPAVSLSRGRAGVTLDAVPSKEAAVSLTVSQKAATAVMPVAAISLAFLTSGAEWNPPRPWGSWEATLAAAAAPPAPAVAPADPAAPAPGAPATPATPPAAKTPDAPAPKPEPARPEPAKPTTPPAPPTPPALPPGAPKSLPAPDDIEFKVSGVPASKLGTGLKTPAAARLDVHVTASGMSKVGNDFTDAAATRSAIEKADAAKKDKGLLLVLANSRAPWDGVRDTLAAGAQSGWTRVGLAVAAPEDLGKGRVLEVALPSNAAPETEKGVDLMVVKVVGSGISYSFTVNGDKCADAAALQEKAKALHEELQSFAEGYADEADKTPWTVDGAGASAAGVVSAVDALGQAGIPKVRLAGVTKAAPEAEKPAEPAAPPAPPEAPKPAPEGEKPAPKEEPKKEEPKKEEPKKEEPK